MEKNLKLSILICSLYKRSKNLCELLNVLNKQKNENIEILVEVDNGEITIGKKRNILLQKASGEYVAFIDDDDLVSEFYVSKILKAIENNPDCVGITGIITVDGKNPKYFVHSIKYDHWFEDTSNTSIFTYYRNPNHLNPIKTKLALKVGFTEKNHGEDKDFSMAIKPFLKTEVFIEEPLYFYRFKTKKE